MIRKAVTDDYKTLVKYYNEFDVNNVDIFEKGPFTNLFVYELDRNVVGFINYSIMYDRAEINYIYVNKNYRKKNIASELMEFMIVDAVDNGCENITLEVSEKNTNGIKLYEKFGFEKKAVRKNYYKDSDALLMMKELIKNVK